MKWRCAASTGMANLFHEVFHPIRLSVCQSRKVGLKATQVRWVYVCIPPTVAPSVCLIWARRMRPLRDGMCA